MSPSRPWRWSLATLVLGLGVAACAPSPSPTPQPAAPEVAPTSEVLPATAVPDVSGPSVPTAEPPASATGAPDARPAERAAVAFTFPQPDAKVASPVEVCLEATGIAIEPAGEAREGAGYFVLVIDPMAQEMSRLAVAGAPAVPVIDRYVHWADGASCGEVALGSGPHVLLAVVVDGSAHPVNPPATARVRIQVGGAPTE